jgi:hypothetical protein
VKRKIKEEKKREKMGRLRRFGVIVPVCFEVHTKSWGSPLPSRGLALASEARSTKISMTVVFLLPLGSGVPLVARPRDGSLACPSTCHLMR